MTTAPDGLYGGSFRPGRRNGFPVQVWVPDTIDPDCPTCGVSLLEPCRVTRGKRSGESHGPHYHHPARPGPAASRCEWCDEPFRRTGPGTTKTCSVECRKAWDAARKLVWDADRRRRNRAQKGGV